MLKIREQQKYVLDEISSQVFEVRLMDALAEHFPEQFAAARDREGFEQGFRRWMQAQLDRAALHGIEYEGDHAVFVALAIENTLTDPSSITGDDCLPVWARPIINMEKGSGRIKMALVEQSLQERSGTNNRAANLLEIVESLRNEFG